jgi:hypothetical protein
MAREGCGVSIPTDDIRYIGEMHGWLLSACEELEKELGIDFESLVEAENDSS